MKCQKYELLNTTVIILIVYFTMCSFTGLWPWNENPYNSFSLQAEAWLNGRLDIEPEFTWLELGIYDDKSFVVFPPFPSYVLLPFVALFGRNTPDHWISLTITLIGVIYALNLHRIRAYRTDSSFWTLFLYLSNGYMFISLQGWVWFFAQTLCFTLSLMTLFYAEKGKGCLSLACWACAVGCRPMVIVYFPYILLRLYRASTLEICKLHQNYIRSSYAHTSTRVKEFFFFFLKRWRWFILPLLIGSSYMLLNYIRFGNVFDFGRAYLPEFAQAPAGEFSIDYISENILKLLRFPNIDSNGRFVYTTYDCMSFLLITPIFVVFTMRLIRNVYRDNKNIAESLLFSLSLCVHLIIVLMHKTLGGWQFGNRYLLDALPYIYFFLIKEDIGESLKWTPLFYLGFSINLIGSIATYNFWM